MTKTTLELFSSIKDCSFDINETLSQINCGNGHIKRASWGVAYYLLMDSKNNVVKFTPNPFQPIPKVGDSYKYQNLLVLKLSGRLFKGYVGITLAGSDTYSISLINVKGKIVKQFDNVYCDELTDIIDVNVEKIESYAF